MTAFSPPSAAPRRHLLGIAGLSLPDIHALMDLAEREIAVSLGRDKKKAALKGRTQINLFFEASTRTQASFELAGKRLGADVMNMSVANSSVKKGETLIDTAMTLNAMRPDILSCAITRRARSRCSRRRSGARWSMPATAPTSTRRRPSSTR